MLLLWRAFEGGSQGPGLLPFPGGVADQPSCVMSGFGIMSAALRALKPPPALQEKP